MNNRTIAVFAIFGLLALGAAHAQPAGPGSGEPPKDQTTEQRLETLERELAELKAQSDAARREVALAAEDRELLKQAADNGPNLRLLILAFGAVGFFVFMLLYNSAATGGKDLSGQIEELGRKLDGLAPAPKTPPQPDGTLPTIDAVSPDEGPVGGLTEVTITGTNFESGAEVFFGGVAATHLKRRSAETLSVRTPPGGVGSQAVKVTNPSGRSAERACAYTYLPELKIASVTPAQATLAGGPLVVVVNGGRRHCKLLIGGEEVATQSCGLPATGQTELRTHLDPAPANTRAGAVLDLAVRDKGQHEVVKPKPPVTFV